MIVIYDLLPCSNYEGLVTVLEVCRVSPPRFLGLVIW